MPDTSERVTVRTRETVEHVFLNCRDQFILKSPGTKIRALRGADSEGRSKTSRGCWWKVGRKVEVYKLPEMEMNVIFL
jgi:hypothetical protein